MPETTLTPNSVRIAEDEARWLSAAATKGGVTQNDLLRLALTRLRKELGAASRIKPESVVATARASRYKLTPPRVAAGAARSTATKPSPAAGKKAKSAKVAARTRATRARGS
jgi:hypothetical protein